MSSTSAEDRVICDDGVRLYVRTSAGDDPAIVFPNGMYLVDDIAQATSGRRTICYDLRNRGRSDTIDDAARLARGVRQDADDLECVRRHFALDRIAIVAHSYVAVPVMLYAMTAAARTDRILLIGPMGPEPAAQYPPELSNTDDTLREVMTRLGELQRQTGEGDEQARCERLWSVLRPLYVAHARNAAKIRWSRCDLPNERRFMQYWTAHLLPSLQQIQLAADRLAPIDAPVLIVHGRQDRSAPYGGGRDWAARLPNAKLLTIGDAAHAPWIEAPETVLPAISRFLSGEWPDGAAIVSDGSGR